MRCYRKICIFQKDDFCMCGSEIYIGEEGVCSDYMPVDLPDAALAREKEWQLKEVGRLLENAGEPLEEGGPDAYIEDWDNRTLEVWSRRLELLKKELEKN